MDEQNIIDKGLVSGTNNPAADQSNRRFCGHCGKSVFTDSKFCQSCGKAIEKSIDNNKVLKNYSPIFWNYFGLGILLNIFGRAAGEETGILILYLLLAAIYVYKFSKEINEAMASVGKKNYWPLGLLALVPFGFWVAFLIVRSKLKPRGMWVSKHKSFKLSR